MNTNAILLAGGTGSRLGGLIPKQYKEIDGKPMIYYSLRVLMEHDEIDTVRIVADESWHAFILNSIDFYSKCIRRYAEGNCCGNG